MGMFWYDVVLLDFFDNVKFFICFVRCYGEIKLLLYIKILLINLFELNVGIF